MKKQGNKKTAHGCFSEKQKHGCYYKTSYQMGGEMNKNNAKKVCYFDKTIEKMPCKTKGNLLLLS